MAIGPLLKKVFFPNNMHIGIRVCIILIYVGICTYVWVLLKKHKCKLLSVLSFPREYDENSINFNISEIVPMLVYGN